MAQRTASAFYDAHDNAALGTAIDATLMGAGWRGSIGTWSVTGASNMVVGGGSGISSFFRYAVGGTPYSGNSARSLKYGLDAVSRYSQHVFTANQSGAITWWGMVKFGDPRAQSQTVDCVQLDNAAGGFFIAQLSGAGQLQAHGDLAGSGSQIGTPFTIPLNHWLVLVMVGNQHGTCTLYVYEPTTWTLLGSSSVDQSLGYNSAWTGFRVGRCDAHAGTNPAADQYNEFADFGVYFAADTTIATPQAPGTPTGLAAAVVSTTSLSLSWTAADTNEEIFQIFRAPSGGAFGLIGSVSAGTTSFTDTGLQSGKAYDYQVRSHNVKYDSSNSSTASATTTALAKLCSHGTRRLVAAAPP